MQYIGVWKMRMIQMALCAAIVLAMVAATPAAAWILPVGTEQDHWSDISASGLEGSYDYDIGTDTGLFEVTGGNAGAMDVGPGTPPDYMFGATYRIADLYVNSSGDVVAPLTGTLDIVPFNIGTLPSPHAVGQSLLAGAIEDVLFTGPGELQLLFKITASTAAPDFGGVGNYGVIKMAIFNNSDPLPGDFTADFDFFDSTADTLGVVPEPASLTMLVGGAAIGMLIMVASYRSKRTEQGRLR
jgi:hypothetical protein